MEDLFHTFRCVVDSTLKYSNGRLSIFSDSIIFFSGTIVLNCPKFLYQIVQGLFLTFPTDMVYKYFRFVRRF